MKRSVQQLLVYLAAATGCDMAQQLVYMKVENEMLRAKLPTRIILSPRERNRLLKYGRVLGAAICQLISIVTPRTFQRWLQAENGPKPQRERKPKPGRPKTDEEIRELILLLARANSWGYTRIVGELRKLGTKVSRGTVANILRDEGIDPSPERKTGTWHDFIKRHAATLWSCDFFSTKIWTTSGYTEYFVLFFMHLGSRHVFVSGMTAHPNAAWMMEQAQIFQTRAAEVGSPAEYLIHDCDEKFTKEFDARLQASGVEMMEVGPASPNLNAHAERFVLSIKSECLDHFVVLGEDHLRYLTDNYLTFYNEVRPHQGIGNMPIACEEEEPCAVGKIKCRERLGGLLKDYYRAAA